MLLKLLAFAVAVVPVLLFLRSLLFRRPTRVSQGVSQFKRQLDLAIWIFIAAVGAITLFTVARMAWNW
jgi:hypothetical protein